MLLSGAPFGRVPFGCIQFWKGKEKLWVPRPSGMWGVWVLPREGLRVYMGKRSSTRGHCSQVLVFLLAFGAKGGDNGTFVLFSPACWYLGTPERIFPVLLFLGVFVSLVFFLLRSSLVVFKGSQGENRWFWSFFGHFQKRPRKIIRGLGSNWKRRTFSFGYSLIGPEKDK